jgi:hypothetical protein
MDPSSPTPPVCDSPTGGFDGVQAARPGSAGLRVSLAPRIGLTPTRVHASTKRTAPRRLSVSVMATAGMLSSAARSASASGR